MKKRIVLLILPNIFLILLFFSIVNHFVKSKNELKQIQRESGKYGNLVDVGNSKINVYVNGKENSDFVLVFMSGAGTCSPVLDFKSLYSLFEKKYKIVVVEKAGYGFSEESNSFRDIETVLNETRSALSKVGILEDGTADAENKIILFAHSMSMLEAIYWSNCFPEEICGIVSLDGAIPQMYEKMKINMFVSNMAAFASKMGLTRFFPQICKSSSAICGGTLTDEEKKLYKNFFYNKTMTEPMLAEAKIVKENAKKVLAVDKRDVPTLFFVSNGKGTGFEKSEWNDFISEYSKNKNESKIVQLECSHYVHNFEYEKIFVESCDFFNQFLDEPELLKIFKEAYPNVKFISEYDDSVADWKITVKVENRKAVLYWADGKFLPKNELENKDLYSAFIYKYSKEIPDPKNFTNEDIERIRNYTNPQNRKSGKGTSPFLYDVIYDCKSRISVESHIKSKRFLNKRSNPHESLHKILEKIEADILEAAKTDSDVKFFVDNLYSADSYNWRSISDSGNRSFHSLGLAIDVLPKGWTTKNLYWAWRRDLDKENWMLLPLDRRWMPAQKVIEIFESYGFIWGGKWIIWDNMHFEYRPEVILYNKMNELE